MKKRLLSLLLVSVLLISLLPAASASDLYSSAIHLATSTYDVEGGKLYFDRRQRALLSCDMSVTAADIPEQIDGVPVERILEGCFAGRKDLTRVTIPETVTFIGDRAFNDCSSLTSVTLPNSLRQLGMDAFTGTGCLRQSGYAEYVDHWLIRLYTPKAWGEAIYIEEGTVGLADQSLRVWYPIRELDNNIYLPSTLRYISIEAGDFTLTQKIHFASNGKYLRAEGCCLLSADGKTLVRYYERLNTDHFSKELPYYLIPDGVERIADGAFYGTDTLKYVRMPDSVVDVGLAAFAWSSVEHIRFSPNLERIDDFAFMYSCLREADFGDRLISIGRYAFYSALQLESLVLPATTVSVDEGAFYNCNALKYLCFEGNAPELGYYALGKGDTLLGFYIMQRDGSSTPPNQDVTLCYREGCTGFDKLSDYRTALWTSELHLHDYQFEMIADDCFRNGSATLKCACGAEIPLQTLYSIGHQYDRYGGSCIHCGMPDSIADVKDSDWFARSVAYSIRNGLMEGTDRQHFSPSIPMTRAMLVTVLHRYAGKPVGGTNRFTDVADAQWYTAAVAWAADNGIVNGVGNERFDPNGSITREQIAVILFRHAAANGASSQKRSSFDAFEDGGKVSAYAVEAMQWALAEGIVAGSADGGRLRLNPQGLASRAEVATLLMRYIENTLK